jgi:hypothetical protein
VSDNLPQDFQYLDQDDSSYHQHQGMFFGEVGGAHQVYLDGTKGGGIPRKYALDLPS